MKDAASKSSTLKSSRRTTKLLIACLVILAVGLGLRGYLTHQNTQLLAQLQLEVENAADRGDWPQVEILARQWAETQPEEYEPWGYAADAAMSMGDLPRAAGYLSQIPDQSPVEAFHDLSAILMQDLNEPIDAIQACKRGLEIYPADSELHQRLMFYYTMTCQRDAIVKEGHRAIAVGSDTLATYAYLMGARWLTFTNGYQMNNLWLQSDPGSELFEVGAVVHLLSVRDLTTLGLSGLSPEELGAPKSYYKQQVHELRKKYPTNVELMAVELAILTEDGDSQAVAQALSTAPPETAEDNRFWRFKGWFHASRQEWEQAREALEHSLELYPFDWATEFELVGVLRASEDIGASTAMQQRSMLGQRVTRAIQQAQQIGELHPDSAYDEMEAYFRVCGEDVLADSLRKRRK